MVVVASPRPKRGIEAENAVPQGAAAPCGLIETMLKTHRPFIRASSPSTLMEAFVDRTVEKANYATHLLQGVALIIEWVLRLL